LFPAIDARQLIEFADLTPATINHLTPRKISYSFNFILKPVKSGELKSSIRHVVHLQKVTPAKVHK